MYGLVIVYKHDSEQLNKMSKKDTNTPMSLFFCQSEVDKHIQNKDDKSTAYIIHQNNILQTKYVDLLNEFNELKAEKDSLEEDNDKLQKAKTCLQGHVKNEYIRANNYKMIAGNTEKGMYTLIKFMFSGNIVATPMYMAVPFITDNKLYTLMILLTVVTIHATTLYKGLVELKRIAYAANITKIVMDNKEIEKSNTYLEELVDNF